jgi:hypothetical protein
MNDACINGSLIPSTPFIVGVTGHRDLQPQELLHLRGAVTEFVHRLREHLPDTEIRFAIGMAEGADLLVAQTVLALGTRVNAVLPMPIEQYAADFDPETFALLTELLRHPGVECEALQLNEAQSEAHASSPGFAPRDAMYANLAETLIRGSSLLLALWNGQVSPLPGGTADTVLRYVGLRTEQNKVDVPLSFIDTPAEHESAPWLAYWIPTGRSGVDGAAERGPPCFLAGLGDNVLHRSAAMPPQLASRLAELNDYNHEFQRLVGSEGLMVRDSLMSALPADQPIRDRPMLEAIDRQYGMADALAVYYQRHSDRLFKFFSVATFGMAVAYLAYERLADTNILLFAYLLIMVTGLVSWLVLHGKHWFAKHLMYRVLAETMRAKFFLRLSGADPLVNASEVLSLSGIDRFHGFGWISFVLKYVEHIATQPINAMEPSAHEAACVESAWIQNQQSYFVAKVAQLERNSQRIGWFKQVLFGVIVIAVLVMVCFGDYLHHETLFGVKLQNLLTFFLGLAVVLFGVWELHQNKMATRELLWQYRNQLNHFSRAKAQLSRTTSWIRRREILAELGKDSLMESYLWTIHRYHREHEPPATT